MNHCTRTAVSRTFVALLLCSGWLGACRSAPSHVEYARPYPPFAQKGSVNIQVVRHATTIELTNTTARAYGPSTLWLNARFSRPIEGLKVGETIVLPMKEFRDEHHDAFRDGGFFATETPERLVLAQIETTGVDGKAEMIGFVVVSGVPD